MDTIRMTMGQALVRFLDQQYVSMDGEETKFVDGVFTIFGHGIVCGLGQALDENSGSLKIYQGRNEQSMAHAATAFAKQNGRRRIIACASSIGPGAANMVTAAACATVNNLPLLLLPGDSFATRQPDPVLQQIEQETNLTVTTNNAFQAVCKYWDRVSRPEQLMSAMLNAMRVLTDPAATGAVCIALPQDVQGESFDYPSSFFQKRVHRITRPVPVEEELEAAADVIASSQRPLVICGGGVKYSVAGEELEQFCAAFHIPYAETQAGKSACKSSSPYNLGGIGVTGNLAANTIARQADCIIAVGSRLTDFTTGSKSQFQEGAKLVSVNLSRFHAYKEDAVMAIGDAKATLTALSALLGQKKYHSAYHQEIQAAKDAWAGEMERLTAYRYDKQFAPLVAARNPGSIAEFTALTGGVITQTAAIGLIRREIAADAVIVGAAGSLPGDLQRMWTTEARDSYHMEYGYSCMGYEIAGALGVKLAQPEREVYAMVGDGSYLMLHSALATSIQERKKINVLLFDNCGFGCINNLQMSKGIGSLSTEFRYRENDTALRQEGGLIPVDYAMCAAGYGLKTYTAHNLEELRWALTDAKKQTVSTLIDLKVLPKTMTDGYNAWWHVGIASCSGKEAVRQAYEEKEAQLAHARLY